MYDTILVPLDGSHRAERILPHVEALARANGSRVIFLQVIEPVPVLSTSIGHAGRIDEAGIREQTAISYLRGWRGEFQAKGIEAASAVEHGAVVPAITRLAERENADLIAMASHGRSGIERAFYGSVTAGVLQRIDRPLLLIRSRGM
ncbi:MAG: universal stress protein [Anaerolineales bacterium]|nr:universal stress protein [Anaerolineales bacterium]